MRPKSFLKFIAVIASLYAAYCTLLFFTQRSMIYPGQILRAPQMQAPAGAEEIWFSRGKSRAEAWFFPAKNPAGAVLYAHGNYELIQNHGKDLLHYRDLGFHVLMIEYPGFGDSTGDPSQDEIVALFCRGYDWLVKEKHAPPGSIIAHGRSLGGGVACALSRERKIAALVLESAFTSTGDMAGDFFAPSFLILDRYDNIGTLKQFPGPVLIFHGKNDEVVPYGHSLKLKGAARDVMFVSTGSGHNDLPHDAIFWNAVKQFIAEKRIGAVR